MMNNRKKLQEIIDRLTRAINMNTYERVYIGNNINRHMNKEELMYYLLEDTFKELITLDAKSMSKRAIDIVISIQTLLEEVIFNTQLEFNIGNLKLTKKSFLVMITNFVIHQLNAVLKEENWMDKVQVKIIKTAIGWFNLRSSDTNELLLNASIETLQKLMPDFKDTTTLATGQLDLKLIQEVQNG